MNHLRLLALALLVAAGPGNAAETLAVIGVGDPPAGPDADLGELTHQLRAACRDRVGGVMDVPAMRGRLLGQTSNATLGELDRAYGGALAVYQNGEFESAIRTLRAIVEDLENLPESDEGYVQWRRALLRLAHAASTIGLDAEADAALSKLLQTELTYRPDADQYSPGYRRHFDELRAKVKGLPGRRLVVTAEGRPGTVFVNGRAMGTTPVSLALPAGRYRVGGATGALHVPSFEVDLREEDRQVILDFALAESLRVNAGPGLALAPAQRASGIIRAGAWLGADKVVVASRVVEGDAHFLLGGIYDVRRGALLREGSVRMVAGTVPAVNLGALAAFLLTGQASRDVKDRTPEAPRREIPVASAVRGLAPEAPPAASIAPLPPAPAASAPPTPTAMTSGARSTGAAALSGPRGAAGASAVSGARAMASAPASPVPAPGAAAAPTTPVASLRPSPALSAPGASAVLGVTPPAEDRALGAPPATASGAGLRPRPSWMRPAMWISGGLALGFGALATQQAMAASSARSDANAMLGDGGVLNGDPARYHALDARADRASRNAYVSAGAAVVFAAAAGVLGYMTWDRAPGPPAIRF